MLLWYTFSARDNSDGGRRLEGLRPAFVLWRRLDTGEPITPAPAVAELANGLYRFAYDAAVSGDAVGQVDLLAGTTPTQGGTGGPELSEGDRYLDVSVSRESGVILAGPPKPLPVPSVTTV